MADDTTSVTTPASAVATLDKAKEEAGDIVSPRSLQPSSSSSPPEYQLHPASPRPWEKEHKNGGAVRQTPQRAVGEYSRGRRLPTQKHQLQLQPISDKEYYRRLYASADEEWGSAAAEAFVHLMRVLESSSDREERSTAWKNLNAVCNKTEHIYREKQELKRLQKDQQERTVELRKLRELQIEVKNLQKRPRRKRTLSLSPRAFAESPVFGFGFGRPKSLSTNNSPRSTSPLPTGDCTRALPLRRKADSKSRKQKLKKASSSPSLPSKQ